MKTGAWRFHHSIPTTPMVISALNNIRSRVRSVIICWIFCPSAPQSPDLLTAKTEEDLSFVKNASVTGIKDEVEMKYFGMVWGMI